MTGEGEGLSNLKERAEEMQGRLIAGAYYDDYDQATADLRIIPELLAFAKHREEAPKGAMDREGPAPLPLKPTLHCFGCKHLVTEDWREPSGDGETYDSGTSACCAAVPRKWISAYWSRGHLVPSWCPFLTDRDTI